MTSQRAPVGARHVAIIMDGNGRWAQKRGMPRTFGHKAGVEALREIIKYSDELGIEALASSTPSTRFRSFHTSWRFLAQEIYFFHRDLVRPPLSSPANT